MYQQFYENKPYFPYADCLDSAQQYETFLANYSSGRYWPMHAISSNANVLPFAYQTYSKRKSSQVRFTAVQISALEKRFSSNKYLSPEERRILSSDLKLSDRQVKTWFQNRRAKWRRSNCPSSSNEKIQDSDSDLEELLVCDEKK
ncbi:PREDICTED: hematopoietically-expressed homeobox protein hhex-like [Nicrophorus vespilloides]|uniref:Hematopoietically-expressed homeobox protein hhex-like n=1 Tax=Nicrophorus vespilloides TaxID=110193 RepID=A0ABM1M9Q9_NICVS|nr:PREDICTED: hematopoietically-expressed homeobox protein hhex-like [Nicrophorus vespilloides]